MSYQMPITTAILYFLAGLCLAEDSWDAVDVDVRQYRHWPGYEKHPIESIKPQPWRNVDDVIEGWDWSLPPGLKPADNSLICLSRDAHNTPKVSFPANPVVSLWIFWSQLEPEEGVYKFDELTAQIRDIEARGYGVIIRPITAVYARPDYPDASTTQDWRKGHCAPPWLVSKYNVTRIEEKPRKEWRIINLDPAHPEFHRAYCRLVKELGNSGIPRMDAVKGFVVGYKSISWGDEGIGPRPEHEGGEELPHVKERLDAWAEACKGVEHKVSMGGVSDYGFEKGFGIRGGFVEMYLYRIPDTHLGQYVDSAGYLCVDEGAPGAQATRFLGDENEEYEDWWTYRFGKLDSFVYRYFSSSLRLLQMRRNYLLNNPFCVYPEMLPFVSLEMGRTVEDTPDVWCALRESYLRGKRGEPQPLKNFERWLYQRDSEGYTTEPAVRIDHAIRMWMVHGDVKSGEGSYYDYVARRGSRIGLRIDERFLKRLKRAAVKVTFLDEKAGELRLKCGEDVYSAEMSGSGKMRTATFFVHHIERGAVHDLVIEGTPDAVVAFVRVVDVENQPLNGR